MSKEVEKYVGEGEGLQGPPILALEIG